jgi:hypothetical protein
VYDIEVLDRLPEEPFKVTHNEYEMFGGLVQITPAGFTYWDGTRTIEVDADTYDAKSGNGMLKFTAPEIESSITVRPLTLADRALLNNGDSIETIENLRAAIYTLLVQSVSP